MPRLDRGIPTGLDSQGCFFPHVMRRLDRGVSTGWDAHRGGRLRGPPPAMVMPRLDRGISTGSSAHEAVVQL
jgi:hypothetical protein